jgi:hypothetical protein
MPAADSDPPAVVKRPNSFQLLGSILSAAAGVRANSARGRGFADASTGAIVGALLIFCAIVWVCGYAFIQAIKSAIAS